MSADSLYDNLRSYLRLATRVVEQRGRLINVGEKFTVRFTGSNTAYASGTVRTPDIIFKGARVYIEGTSNARPVGGNGWRNLPDGNLFPGESSFVDVEFEALADDWGIDAWDNEKIARAFISADLDQDRFFRVWNVRDIYEEISPT